MPKRAKVPPAVRREWLQAYERGERIDALAKTDGRAPRTVKEHILRAQQERQQEQVRMGLLKDAYSDHFKDLLGVAQDLRKSSLRPHSIDLVKSGDLRQRKLLAALKSHIPLSPLWNACADWKAASELLETRERAVKQDIATAVTDLRRSLPEITPDGFKDSLWFVVEQTAGGGAMSHIQYREKKDGDIVRLEWGPFCIAQLAAEATDEAKNESPDGVQSKHQKMLGEAMSRGEGGLVARLADPLQQWKRAQAKIEEEVENLLLRRIVSGQCSLCPGGEGIGGGKAERKRRTG
ncbi:MAG: hypothetical protein AAB303_05020 [Chloroflexota bacterium]